MEISKKDWIIFKEKLPEWQEKHIENLNNNYIKLLSSDKPSSEKFWALERRINNDKNNPGVRLRLSRSDAIWQIVAMINYGVISYDDLDEFSNELQETVKRIIE